MAREFSRTQRVADYLQRELALLIQQEVDDPRVGMVSLTGVDVSRDLAHAKVWFTRLGSDSAEEATEAAAALNGAAGYLRTLLSRETTMRSVPRLRFAFDSSVGRGRHMEELIREAGERDRALDARREGDDAPDGEG